MAEVRRAFDDPSFASANDGAGVPAAVYTIPWNDETYIALLQAWLSEYRRNNRRLEPRHLEEALAGLARFHALLHSPRYVGRLPSIVSRSLNRLRSACESLLFRADGPASARDAVMVAYVVDAGERLPFSAARGTGGSRSALD